MWNNPVINQLPTHLKGFITDQHHEQYTAEDHAVWRYVMRKNLDKLSLLAHPSYSSGLKKTGISIEQIPSIEDMNQILGKLGWAAVAVDGFIPPAAFMEFQKHNVLVIAADIRSLDQIEYTPAPDIIHEAAGHAPIIADESYATYLQYFGEIGSKAFSSKKDYELYEAIRHLSILKADVQSDNKAIEKAEQAIEEISAHMGVPSEMAYIRNLHWWTVEYGLIGTVDQPKIYGAGLLSSIGESMSVMKKDVLKLPYSIEAIQYNFDITKPQPQLFVTPDFDFLTQVLDEFASTMSLRQGGLSGLLKAIESENPATAVYASGLQVSGTFAEVMQHNGEPIYLKTKGETILCYNDQCLPGHGKQHHQDGFGSPVGRIHGALKPTRLLSDQELKALGLEHNKMCKFEFESGVSVSGIPTAFVREEGILILISFRDCLVTHEDQVLFQPDWGVFDMAVGESIVSVYNGPADPEAFGLQFDPPAEKTHKIVYPELTKRKHLLYQLIRDVREGAASADELASAWELYKKHYTADWLLAAEFHGLAEKLPETVQVEITDHLRQLKLSQPHLENLINYVLNKA